MNFILKISCDTEAFTEFDNPAEELEGIFYQLHRKFEDMPAYYLVDGYSQTILDSNGSEVGHWSIEEKK